MMEEIQQQQSTQSQTSLKSIKAAMKTEEFWTQTNIDSIGKNILTNIDFTWMHMVGYIFSSYQNLAKFAGECSKIPKGLCAGSITMEQQCYKCFDCGRDTQYHIFCSKCFESGFLEGKHKNHRFKSQMRLNGSCDCGEVNSIQKSGFCSSHSGKKQCDMKLDQAMYTKLQQVILKCFETLFNYCDESMTYTKLFPESNIIVSPLKLGQINQIINNVIQTLVHFICDFGEDKIPFKFAISKIMMKPFNRKLMHGCNSNKFEDTFSRRQQHICHNSISQLILKYSIALEYKEDLIDHIFYSLFVNTAFRKYLSNVFQDSISFILIIFKKPRELPVCSVLQPFLLFCQFLAGEYTDNFVLNPSFNNIIQKSKLIIQIVNKQYFGQFDTALKLLGVYQRIQQTISAEKKQYLAVKVISYFLDLSTFTSSQNGNSYQHHQYKLTLNLFLINLFQGYISIIKYQEKQSKDSIVTLIHKYFQNLSRSLFINPEDESKQKIDNKMIQDGKMLVQQQHSQTKQVLIEDDGYDHTLPIIKLDWYRLTEYEIGILIVSLYVQFGYEELQKILILEVKHGFIQVFINKLIAGQINGYKISKSKDVGFPNQYTPKQLYKFFIKFPQRLLYDSSLSILQVVAYVFPQQFIKELKNIQQAQYLCKLLTDVILQQTAFVNFSSKCNFESQLAENSLKIEMINILNLKSKNTFAELKKSFINQMFFQQSSFEQVLIEVATYDPKTQCYVIKQKYKNLQEGVFVRRAEDEFGNLFVGQDSYMKLIDKGNLIQKQNQQNWNTICQLATKSLAQSPQFLEIFEKITQYVWFSEQSVNNYQNIQLIFAILIRNNNQKLKNILQHILESNISTLPQKLMKRILNKLNNINTQASLQKPIASLNSKQNRMKAHIQKLKKQQSLFEQNNTQLFEQATKTMVQERQCQQEVCLICHQGKVQDQYPCFTLYLSNQIISDQQILVYNSCGHLFHSKCIEEHDSNNCPFCITPWNTLFPILPSSSFQMMNPISNENIKLISVNKQLNFRDVDVVLQKITQLIFSKIYFSVLNSCQKFAKRDLKQLRSLYVKCVLSNQQQRSFISCEQLVQGLYKRVSLLTQQNQSAKNIPKLLYSLILLPLYMDCQKVKQVFNFVVTAFYTSIYVDNLLCFVDTKKQDIQGQIKFHEDTLCAKMNEFSKVIAFTYALLFEDKRNQILENIKDQDAAAEILKQTYKQFLLVQPKFFFSYYNKAKQIPNRKNNIPKSLVPAPVTVSLPENYLKFHHQYYTLNCVQCEGIAQANDKNQLWMCLLCGYRSCLKNCPVQDTAPDASLYLHFANSHHNIGIAIQMNSSLVAIIDRDFQFQYGYLYQDRYGRYNNEKIKKWTQLKLNDNKWNKLLQIIRKGMLITYAAQNRLPYHRLEY